MLATVTELARRKGVCPNTIRRRLRLIGAMPDDTLANGRREPLPVFDIERPEIARLLQEPQVIL